MLVINYNEDGSGFVSIRKDWHLGRVSKAYTGQKYRNHTSAGLEFQKIVMQDKLSAAYKRVRENLK